ncbi:unnamed protein product [Peronospora belbahrii]|nr:unnamed protein product [Peronospora belbahrii]
MADRMKMLFMDAPPDALEKLLSPRRKLFYGLFAFGPGTILGLYLYSVKKRMERENEAMRLEKVEGEITIIQERQDKDMALANAIQEMRDRLERLEKESIANRQNTAKEASVASNKTDTEKKQAVKDVVSQSASKIDVALAVLKSNEQSGGNQQKVAASPSWLQSSFEGPQGRREQRQYEMLHHDIAVHVAKQKEQAK